MTKIKRVKHDPSDLVKQSNPVTTARYDLSPVAMKAFLLAYSKLTPEDEEFAKFSFSLGEVARVLGEPNADFRHLVTVLHKLEGARIYVWDGDDYVSIDPLPTIRISEAKKTVVFTLNPELQPYFLGLKQQYTMFPVEHAFRLHGRYSIRMYQLIMQWQGKEKRDHTWEVELEVQELRAMWGIGAEEYKLMSSFRRDVIERAVMEINSAQLGVFLTVLPPKKNGKHITHFVIQARRVSPSEPRQVTKKPVKHESKKEYPLGGEFHDLIEALTPDQKAEMEIYVAAEMKKQLLLPGAHSLAVVAIQGEFLDTLRKKHSKGGGKTTPKE